MGETPEAPECLSEEGHEFLSHCLEHDPKLRWTTVELLQHYFCKVSFSSILNLQSIRKYWVYPFFEKKKINWVEVHRTGSN